MKWKGYMEMIINVQGKLEKKCIMKRQSLVANVSRFFEKDIC